MTEPSGAVQIQELILRFINISVPISFLILTVMILYSGIKFIRSGGDPKETAAARAMIIGSVTGIAFLALAWIAIKMVEGFTGVQLSVFCFGFKGGPNNCP